MKQSIVGLVPRTALCAVSPPFMHVCLLHPWTMILRAMSSAIALLSMFPLFPILANASDQATARGGRC